HNLFFQQVGNIWSKFLSKYLTPKTIALWRSIFERMNLLLIHLFVKSIQQSACDSGIFGAVQIICQTTGNMRDSVSCRQVKNLFSHFDDAIHQRTAAREDDAGENLLLE